MPKDKDTKTKKTAKASGKGEKFADMSTGPIIDETKILEDVGANHDSPEKSVKGPRVRGKKYQEARKMVNQGQSYTLKEALELLKKVAFGKNQGTVEVHLNVLEKGLSGEANLPHFKGKARRVVVFSPELGEEIKTGKISFDVLLASPADMPKILPLAKVLGPKGLMPNPKNGTLVPNPEEALKNFGGSSLHFKTEKDFPLIHTAIGKLDQPVEELTANFETLIKAVNPKNVKKAVIKSTMSPGIKVSLD